MSPKEKSIWMLSVYNSQYEDYKMQAIRTDLTEAQKEVLREKKDILTRVYPMISIYTGYAGTGIIPEKELEMTIISNLETLLSML
jgi:hypothetical protein